MSTTGHGVSQPDSRCLSASDLPGPAPGGGYRDRDSHGDRDRDSRGRRDSDSTSNTEASGGSAALAVTDSETPSHGRNDDHSCQRPRRVLRGMPRTRRGASEPWQ